MSATPTRQHRWSSLRRGLLPMMLAVALVGSASAAAEEPVAASDAEQSPDSPGRSAIQRAALFTAGATAGLLAHEAGHLLFKVAFDAEPGFRRVELAGIPFFAITHRGDLSPRREYAVSAAGFWVQQALAEWILTSMPDVRRADRPFQKGVLAWHVLSSAGYFAVAMGEAGPPERDTRGMATSLGVSERWVGALVLIPAACDAWRYVRPQARWPRWVSRAAKAGLIVAVVAARG